MSHNPPIKFRKFIKNLKEKISQSYYSKSYMKNNEWENICKAPKRSYSTYEKEITNISN